MKLFPPQQKVIEGGLLRQGHHLLLNMATGSGKTYLSEMMIEDVIKAGYKAIYVTPLRALASQQFNNWKRRFPNYNVGVFTGDTIQKSNTRGNYSTSQILIMTPERLDACMRNWRSHWAWIPEVSLIVIDEFHILGHSMRGGRLEGTITRLVRLNPFARIVGLSATMPNANELAQWLHGSYFASKWRQVPIEKKIIRFSSAKDKPEMLLSEVERCIASGGQSLVFCNSRSRVQHVAEYLNEHGIEAKCHHAGLAKEKREETEHNFKAGHTLVLVATSTLEMGLNLPARQVIIYDSYSYSESGFSPLPVWSFIQRAGRAGRPGMDENGEVVLMLPKWAGNADKYRNEECEDIDSQLTMQKAMSEQILIDVFAGFSRTRNELINGFLPLTLYKTQHSEANINGSINRLVSADLLVEKEKENDDGNCERFLSVGLLGRMAVKLMLAPETIKMVRDVYKAFPKLYLFDLLLLTTLNIDCSPILQANYEEMDALCDIVQPLPSHLLDLTVEQFQRKIPDAPGTLRILAGIKMAAICYALTDGREIDYLAETFDVFEADIQMLQESVARLLQGVSAITSALDKSAIGDEMAQKKKQEIDSTVRLSAMLYNMLLYEINNELVGLTQLKGVGGKIAKNLAKGGYATMSSLAEARPCELNDIEGIGKKLAASIVKQAKELTAEGKQVVYSEHNVEIIHEARAIKTTIDPYRLRRSMELVLKGREGYKYLVAGGREDHVVLYRDMQYTCDCLDYTKNGGLCKHILCVKHAMGDPEVCRMIKRIKESKSHTIREALPSLWFSITAKERD